MPITSLIIAKIVFLSSWKILLFSKQRDSNGRPEKERKEKSGSCSIMGCACFAAALISIGICIQEGQCIKMNKFVKSVL